MTKKGLKLCWKCELRGYKRIDKEYGEMIWCTEAKCLRKLPYYGKCEDAE